MTLVREERRLTAILVADIVGYSSLVDLDEAGTLASVRALHSEVIDPLLAERNGRIVKLMGDGMLAEFGSVVDAVSCATTMQKDVGARQSEVPSNRRIRFRIGVNLGDVIVDGKDLLGAGVNVAARLEQLCPPGGVLISGTAYDHLKGRFNLTLDYLGRQQVKNISEPVRVYSVRIDGVKRGWALHARRFRPTLRVAAALAPLLAVAGIGIWWFQPVVPARSEPSIAVLPFDNLGGDEMTDRLAAGVTEDVITDLARFRGLDVIARNSTEVYADKSVDVREVGRALNVRYVLEGSIQRDGGQIRVTAQLIDAASGAHLWSERWDRPAADIFSVQSEVAEQVAGRLTGSFGAISEAERLASRRARPEDLKAYDLFQLGREAALRSTKESTEEAIRLFRQALDKDPKLARSWVALAYAYDLTTHFGAESETARPAAMQAVQRALEIDPLDAEAHAAFGHLLGMAGDLGRADAEFERALQLNPNDVGILTNYAGWASTFGNPERGAEAADRAIRLNPNYATSAAGFFRLAYFMAGRNEDALRLVEREDPATRTRGGWVQRAAIYAALGKDEEARKAVSDALERHPDLTVEGFALNSPGYSDTERQHLVKTMRAAGFPLCVSEQDLRETPSLVRLPECVQS